jgi:hypothetical protein
VGVPWGRVPMAVLPAPGDDTVMLEGGSSSNPRYAVPASAHALQRAAGALQTGAGSPQAVESLPATVAHLEEALDRLATGVERMALAVAEWSESGSEIVDEDALPPDARALRWHPHTTAQALSSSRDACAASRQWARRLLDRRRDPADTTMLPGATRDDRFDSPDDAASSCRPSGRADAIGPVDAKRVKASPHVSSRALARGLSVKRSSDAAST